MGELAIRAKNGEQEATNRLLELFNPLICKISEQIYVRYGKLFPLEEIIRQSRCILVYLTVVHYDPNGKAHYPYFIKKILHAHLVQLYRPMYVSTIKIISLEKITASSNITRDEVYADERHIIYEKLIKYIDSKFNERERDLIYNYFCGNVTRIALVHKYGISRQRMNVIHHKIIDKLKQYLHILGVDKFEDI